MFNLNSRTQYDLTNQSKQMNKFEADTENFHQEMVEKLLLLSPADQALLIHTVRKYREERAKEQLKMIAQSEQKLKQQFKHPQMIKFIEHTYQYIPKSTLTSDIREKLLRCLHYRYFQPITIDMCVICHIQSTIGCSMVMLGCSHHYHIQCIQKWFKNTMVCPLCKDTTISHNEMERIRDVEAQIKQLNVSRAAIVGRNKDTSELLQSIFLSKLKPSTLPINDQL